MITNKNDYDPFLNWTWLYKIPQGLVGFSFLFVYWDKYAEVLEFNIFNKPFSFWVKPVGKSKFDSEEL